MELPVSSVFLELISIDLDGLVENMQDSIVFEYIAVEVKKDLFKLVKIWVFKNLLNFISIFLHILCSGESDDRVDVLDGGNCIFWVLPFHEVGERKYLLVFGGKPDVFLWVIITQNPIFQKFLVEIAINFYTLWSAFFLTQLFQQLVILCAFFYPVVRTL